MNYQSANYDVIVVGAGAVGLSVAYELAQKPLKIAIISPANPKGVASLAAGAMIDAFGEISDLHTEYEHQKLKLEVEAQRMYLEWLEDITERTGKSIFTSKGLFMVSNRDGQFDKKRMRLIKEQLAVYNEPFDEPEPENIPGLKPNYQFPVHKALYLKNAMSVDTEELLAGLERAISKSGRVFRIHDMALEVKPKENAWQVQTSKNGKIKAARVIICAGAHSFNIMREALRLKAHLPKMFFGRGSSVLLQDAPKVPHIIRTPNRVLACGLHLVPRANNKLYVGGTNWFGTDFSLPKGPSVLAIHSLLDACMNQLNSSLSEASIVKMNWGLRPVTAYDRPLVGETVMPGLFVATGTHRTGVHLAPIIAKLLVADLTKEEVNYKNIFSPILEYQPNAKPNYDLAMRGLLAVATYPSGGLPYNRLEEMQVFLEEIFKLAVNDKDGDEQLRERLHYWLKEIPPIEQSLLKIYNEVRARYLPKITTIMS